MKVAVLNMVTLDGVMQGAGRVAEHPRGGFEHVWPSRTCVADGDLVLSGVAAGRRPAVG